MHIKNEKLQREERKHQSFEMKLSEFRLVLDDLNRKYNSLKNKENELLIRNNELEKHIKEKNNEIKLLNDSIEGNKVKEFESNKGTMLENSRLKQDIEILEDRDMKQSEEIKILTNKLYYLENDLREKAKVQSSDIDELKLELFERDKDNKILIEENKQLNSFNFDIKKQQENESQNLYIMKKE